MKNLMFALFLTAAVSISISGCRQASAWETGLGLKMDKSANIQLFIEQSTANETEWKVAYDFLKNNDLSKLDTGRYELSSAGTYATVSIYTTKEPETAKYEAHRNYIDIQYVADGEEYIEIIPLEELKEGLPYDPRADILFFNDDTKGKKRLADKTCFFVFFPDDAHKPCLKTKAPSIVRKVVVKIPVKSLPKNHAM